MMYTLLAFFVLSFFAVSFQDEGKSHNVNQDPHLLLWRKLITFIFVPTFSVYLVYRSVLSLTNLKQHKT